MGGWTTDWRRSGERRGRTEAWPPRRRTEGRRRIGGGRTEVRRRTEARRRRGEGKTRKWADGAGRDRGTFSRGGWSMREDERSDRTAARRGSFANVEGKMV